MTSEPVGNTPRGNIPGNTLRNRESAAGPKADIPPVEGKIVTGKVVERKQPLFKRAVRSIVADDVTDVGDYILIDVIIPAFKNLLADIGIQGINRVLFGQGRVRRPGIGGGAGPVTTLRTRYDQMSEDPRSNTREISHGSRARHDFREIVLETRTEAVDIIEQLVNRINVYGQATVKDMYDYMGVSSSYVDQSYGWMNLAGASVRQIREGFILDMPQPVQIR